MKNLSKLFIAFLLFQLISFAQAPNIQWAKTFGGSGNDVGTVVIETTDNGFIVGGGIRGIMGMDSYLIKLNNIGDTLWTSSSYYINNGHPYFTSVQPDLYELNPGHYLMGFDGGFGGLLRVKSNGDSVQYHMLMDLGSGMDPRFGNMSKTYDGNYILSEGTWFGGMGRLIKADSLGNVIWDKWYTGPIRYVIQTYDGGFATIGKKFGGMGPFLGILLRKTNSEGDTLWTKLVYPDTSYVGDYTSSKCLLQSTDGGYFILCNEHNDTTGNYNIILFRTNELGDTLWTKKYGGSGIDYGEYFTKTPDGGYIIVGTTESFGAGGSDVWLVKIDSLGNTQWTKTIGGPEDDYGKYVQVTSDSGYIITGSTYSYGEGESDLWVIKLTHNPVSVDNTLEIIDNYNLSQNFPNPFNPSTKIRYQVPEISFVTIKVYNVLGREVITLVNEEQQAGTYELEFNAATLSSGIYFYRLQTGSFVETKKMVLLK